MEKNYRLFIRNLPSSVTNNNLEEIFNEYGTIGNIDIKEKLQNDETKIAFINITTTERQLNNCCRNVNSVVLENHKISVQIAKESFLDRLKRERDEATLKNINKQKPIVIDETIEPINIKVHVPFVKQNVKKKFTDDFIESIESEPIQVINEQPLDKTDDKYSGINYNEKKTIVSFDNNNANINLKLKEKKILSESEMKRIASLKMQKQIFKAKEQMIRDALKIVDNNRKNKIIFDDNIDECNYKGGEYSNKLLLFNNDDDDGIDTNFDNNFNERPRPKFKTIGGDERFKMDERFFDDDDDDNDKLHDKKQIETDVIDDEYTSEKKLELEILTDVLGKPIANNDNKNIPAKKMNKMIRYDPNEDNHRNYVIKKDEKTSVSNKKRKKYNEVVEDDVPSIPVSNEVFYSVSNTLTETLKSQETFSLLKTFGSTTPSEINMNENYETVDIPKKQGRFEFNFDAKNPFKYDSSDDETENYSNRKYSIEVPNSKLTSKCIPLERCDTFFFIPNDARLKEAEEFFQTKSTSNETFKNVRRELKEIVRAKVRNNKRKNQPWKKKIGNKSRSM